MYYLPFAIYHSSSSRASSRLRSGQAVVFVASRPGFPIRACPRPDRGSGMTKSVSVFVGVHPWLPSGLHSRDSRDSLLRNLDCRPTDVMEPLSGPIHLRIYSPTLPRKNAVPALYYHGLGALPARKTAARNEYGTPSLRPITAPRLRAIRPRNHWLASSPAGADLRSRRQAPARVRRRRLLPARGFPCHR
jgi:hypothetical protein